MAKLGDIDFDDVSASGKLDLDASTTTQASLNLGHGTAPTSPVNGDIWVTSAGLYVRVDGSTVGPLTGA